MGVQGTWINYQPILYEYMYVLYKNVIYVTEILTILCFVTYMYHHDWTAKTQTEKLQFFLPIVTPDKMIPVVVQNIVTITSSLAVKMLTVLVSTISNSLVILLKK